MNRYGDVQAMIVDHLASLLHSKSRHSVKDLQKKIDEWIDNNCKGNLAHASALRQKLSMRGGSQPMPPKKMPGPKKELEKALVNSIHHGLFFDRIYWYQAQKSGSGSNLQPIYLSSILAGECLKDMHKCE